MAYIDVCHWHKCEGCGCAMKDQDDWYFCYYLDSGCNEEPWDLCKACFSSEEQDEPWGHICLKKDGEVTGHWVALHGPDCCSCDELVCINPQQWQPEAPVDQAWHRLLSQVNEVRGDEWEYHSHFQRVASSFGNLYAWCPHDEWLTWTDSVDGKPQWETHIFALYHPDEDSFAVVWFRYETTGEPKCFLMGGWRYGPTERPWSYDQDVEAVLRREWAKHCPEECKA